MQIRFSDNELIYFAKKIDTKLNLRILGISNK